MPADKHLQKLEKLFLGLGDKTRLRILNLIRNDEICVTHFTEVLGESQPKISRHLAYLRRSGIVSARREGTWMHYSIEWPAEDNTAELMHNLLDGLAAQPEMQKDRARLVKSLGGVTAVKQKEKAPNPELEKSVVAALPKPAETVEPDWREEEPLETYLL